MKKILFITLIAGGIYLATKFKTNIGALQQIKSSIKRVTSVKVANGSLNLKLDLNITNLSEFNLGVDTYGLLSIRRLRFFNAKNRQLIGEAKVNISNIELPSNKTIVLADIIAEVPLQNVLKHLSLFSSDAANNIRVVPMFNAAGKEFEINPENFT